MATPQSTTSYQGAEPAEAKTLEQITFRFCSECSNMLYPKEDEEAHKLQFTCRTCQYTEDARSTCVFRNILNNSAGETAGVTQDVGADPTVSDHDALPVCLHCGIAITCNTCDAVSPDYTVTTVPREQNADYMAAFASNVGWTEEDLFDEFGDEAVMDFGDGVRSSSPSTDSERQSA
ncbi:DNA directed RNA polymerase II 15 kDa subunit, putative [Cordyceps militaris CM01]|uniref:DNA directed RNA polymerase II 15 kDa subunit, putative n=1 Tax=Cordyceps militaris (strain CM01) TaxID=983644 RepID=G3JNL8_CORMM|nr:DNA directed RNA polymerase II 15 kDa subunit, putative [Cordyceps militaris CM01]EGX89858.1 DNA directed RNA polymerase II 15 kDa subunit, putative [Cordyceps militaris CM01]